MKPEQKDKLKLSTYSVEIFMLITLFTALSDKISTEGAIWCAIPYVLAKGLADLSRDLYKSYGECRLVNVVGIAAVIIFIIAAFSAWSTGIISLNHVIFSK